MSCKELIGVITDYLESRLPAPDRTRFEEHLAICPGCQIYLDQMRLILRTLGRLEEESVSADARDELLHVFRDWKKT